MAAHWISQPKRTRRTEPDMSSETDGAIIESTVIVFGGKRGLSKTALLGDVDRPWASCERHVRSKRKSSRGLARRRPISHRLDFGAGAGPDAPPFEAKRAHSEAARAPTLRRNNASGARNPPRPGLIDRLGSGRGRTFRP